MMPNCRGLLQPKASENGSQAIATAYCFGPLKVQALLSGVAEDPLHGLDFVGAEIITNTILGFLTFVIV